MRLHFPITMSIAALVAFGASSGKPAVADAPHAATYHTRTHKIAAAQPLSPRPRPKIASRRSSATANRRMCVEAPRPIAVAAPPVRAVGPAQTGSAAWYGGKYIGRRTSSGEVLDRITPTAAHRTLPLNSLVRVTNLGNGRSVVAKVNDRGPVSQSFLIDMSPKAAEQLDMTASGVARVRVEQVVAVPPDAE